MNKKNQNQTKGGLDGDLTTRRCKELLLVCTLIILTIGCGTLYGLMEQNWALTSPSRERVLAVAGFLVLSSIVLCYYIISTEQTKRFDLEIGSNTEIVCLLIDRPPSYDSLKETPPPTYKAVITGAYIVPCHKSSP